MICCAEVDLYQQGNHTKIWTYAIWYSLGIIDRQKMYFCVWVSLSLEVLTTVDGDMKDYARVIKGAMLVLDQVMKRARPDVRWRFERAKFHLTELAKIVVDIRNDSNRVKDTESQEDTSNYNASNSDGSSQERSDDKKHQKTEAVRPSPVKRDPIGFEPISKDERVDYAVESEVTIRNKKQMRENAVPSTQFGRFVGFGSLAVRMALGEVVDRAAHVLSGKEGPRVISDDNAKRLADSLCKMRGAALKLGQMLSLQDESSLPPSLVKALDRVRQSADYMPTRQLEGQLVKELGKDWRDKLASFDPVPIAAASIGQVHRAVLLDGTEVAMKIQYPGVADSIDSDLGNLKGIVSMTNVLPRGLFIDNIIKVASEELQDECNYELEARNQTRYRECILADEVLRKHTSVPEVFPELSTARVLTGRLISGESIEKAVQYPQSVRNAIARTLLIVSIKELFIWRLVQSDPNYGNFLYNHAERKIHLLDFGATREYRKEFVDDYMVLVWSAANKDRQRLLEVSKSLGFLTGDETAEFISAHIEAGMVVGEPFALDEPFDFANSKLTVRLEKYGGTFMKHRLTPPPNEVYSLHRKLAGAFLLCIKLKAVIPCRDILEECYNEYYAGLNKDELPISSGSDRVVEKSD